MKALFFTAIEHGRAFADFVRFCHRARDHIGIIAPFPMGVDLRWMRMLEGKE